MFDDVENRNDLSKNFHTSASHDSGKIIITCKKICKTYNLFKIIFQEQKSEKKEQRIEDTLICSVRRWVFSDLGNVCDEAV